MIAVCPNCKSIFEARGIVIQNASNVTLSNNTTRCRNCGAKAQYLDGTFNFDSNGIMTVLSAPQFTKDILNRIKTLVEDVQNERITPEEFHEEVDSLPPVIKSVVELVIPKEPNGFWAMIGAVLIVLNQLVGSDTDKKTDQTSVEAKPQIELIMENPHDTILPNNDSLPPIDDTTLLGNR